MSSASAPPPFPHRTSFGTFGGGRFSGQSEPFAPTGPRRAMPDMSLYHVPPTPSFVPPTLFVPNPNHARSLLASNKHVPATDLTRHIHQRDLFVEQLSNFTRNATTAGLPSFLDSIHRDYQRGDRLNFDLLFLYPGNIGNLFLFPEELLHAHQLCAFWGGKSGRRVHQRVECLNCIIRYCFFAPYADQICCLRNSGRLGYIWNTRPFQASARPLVRTYASRSISWYVQLLYDLSCSSPWLVIQACRTHRCLSSQRCLVVISFLVFLWYYYSFASAYVSCLCNNQVLLCIAYCIVIVCNLSFIYMTMIMVVCHLFLLSHDLWLLYYLTLCIEVVLEFQVAPGLI